MSSDYNETIIDDEYCKEVSMYYWIEEEEMKIGTHPTQIKERIESWMLKNNIYGEITFLDWHNDHRVGVHINNKFFGVFDYKENLFVSISDNKLV